MKEVSNRAWNVGKVLMFLLSCAASLAVAQENPAIKQAAYLLETDQPTKAVAALQAAVSAAPQDAALLYYLGHAQIKNNERAKAEINFQKGTELDPKNGLNFAGKGQLRMLDNQAAEAKVAFEEALKVSKSKDDEVLKAVAEGYLLDPKQAKEALALLEKVKGKDVDAAVLKGDAYLKLNDGGKAVSSYEYGATYDAKRALPHYKVGLVYLRSKNYDVAEQNFKKATEVDPKYTLAFKELGELYYESRKAKEAVTAYESYMALTEKPESAKLRYAFFLFMAKEYARANPIFDELSKRPDATATVFKYKAYSLTASKDYPAAQSAFAAYFGKVKPEEIQAADYEYLAQMLEESGNDSLAVENYQKSFDLEKKEAVASKIADLTIKAKKYPEAVKAYEQLEALRPKLASAELYGQGRAYYYTEQYAKADSTFQKLIALQPAMTLGYVWQARSVAALDPEVNGKINGTAKPYFEKVIEIGLQRPDKSKNDLIEAYNYMGYYHFTRNEIPQSKGFFEKVLALNPSDARATEILKAMNAPAQKPAPKKS
jgi:tetratricopeptide (TPR) repeat protein